MVSTLRVIPEQTNPTYPLVSVALKLAHNLPLASHLGQMKCESFQHGSSNFKRESCSNDTPFPTRTNNVTKGIVGPVAFARYGSVFRALS